MNSFWNGFEKKAKEEGIGTDVAEVAGLGGLAIPSIRHFAKKTELSPGKYHALELAGLGTLAAYPAYHIGKKVWNKFKGDKAAT